MTAIAHSRIIVVPGATLYDYLMFAHVLAAMLWLGGWAVLGLLAAHTLLQGDPGTLARFAATLRFIGPRLLGPATVLVAGLGVGLVLDSHQWHFSQFWIELAVGLLAAVLVVGAGFQSRAAIGAERAIREDDPDQARRHIRQWAWGAIVILALLVIATWDMTIKP
jgi:putative copper export protein